MFFKIWRVYSPLLSEDNISKQCVYKWERQNRKLKSVLQKYPYFFPEKCFFQGENKYQNKGEKFVCFFLELFFYLACTTKKKRTKAKNPNQTKKPQFSGTYWVICGLTQQRRYKSHQIISGRKLQKQCHPAFGTWASQGALEVSYPTWCPIKIKPLESVHLGDRFNTGPGELPKLW